MDCAFGALVLRRRGLWAGIHPIGMNGAPGENGSAGAESRGARPTRRVVPSPVRWDGPASNSDEFNSLRIIPLVCGGAPGENRTHITGFGDQCTIHCATGAFVTTEVKLAAEQGGCRAVSKLIPIEFMDQASLAGSALARRSMSITASPPAIARPTAITKLDSIPGMIFA